MCLNNEMVSYASTKTSTHSNPDKNSMRKSVYEKNMAETTIHHHAKPWHPHAGGQVAEIDVREAKMACYLKKNEESEIRSFIPYIVFSITVLKEFSKCYLKT